MLDYVIVKLKERNEDPWEAIPKKWLKRDDDKMIWWPDNDVNYKMEYKIMFNGNSRNWSMRPITAVDPASYDELFDAIDRANHLNSIEFMKKQLDEINKNIGNVQDGISNNYLEILTEQGFIKKDIKQLKDIVQSMKHAHIYDNNNNDDDNKETLEDVLPLKTYEGLVEFEKNFINEEWISPALKKLFTILIDKENLIESISKILGAVFASSLAGQCSWDGQNGLIRVSDLLVIKKLKVTLQTIYGDLKNFEEIVTSWFQTGRESASV
ncbi:uncharacterized protein LOC130662890 [Microplitis mediator]|uniref:uncharacterized protein LOC130662890 n=1 Tax=Microplitis mediator TaxID=375433 RepID=UPI002552A569|nr:uncharacterized protein LOC130662890 [Microplitis mediator]XP_057317828.1 uncharacterized protein LOC130662890 [Microplitis mediator]